MTIKEKVTKALSGTGSEELGFELAKSPGALFGTGDDGGTWAWKDGETIVCRKDEPEAASDIRGALKELGVKFDAYSDKRYFYFELQVSANESRGVTGRLLRFARFVDGPLDESHGFTPGDQTDAQRLATSIGDAVRAVFPGAGVLCRVGGNLTKSIWLDFTLGSGKAEWSNGISHNDAGRHSIVVWLDEDGTVPARVKVECTVGGSLMVRSEDRYKVYDRVKTGWRNFTCAPGEVPRRLAEYFQRVKDAVRSNLDRFEAGMHRDVASRRVNEAAQPKPEYPIPTEAGRKRFKAIGAVLDVLGNSDEIAPFAEMVKAGRTASEIAAALRITPEEAEKALEQKDYIIKNWDADIQRLKRIAGDKALTERVARSFAASVSKSVGPKRMAKVIAGDAEVQDFVDANMNMAEAMSKHGFGSDEWPEFAATTELADLWNAAWEMAEENGFWLAVKEGNDPGVSARLTTVLSRAHDLVKPSQRKRFLEEWRSMEVRIEHSPPALVSKELEDFMREVLEPYGLQHALDGK